MPEDPSLQNTPEDLFMVDFNKRLGQIRAEILSMPVSRRVSSEISLWRRFKRYAPIIFILLWLGVSTWMYINPLAGQTLFTLGEPIISSSSELCPGESLDFSVSVDVSKQGVYLLDMSTWRVDPPPATIVFSERDIMVIGEDRSFPIVRQWVVPATYQDPTTNQHTMWKSGKYTRDIAVTASGRNTESSTKTIKFLIREDCS